MNYINIYNCGTKELKNYLIVLLRGANIYNEIYYVTNANI